MTRKRPDQCACQRSPVVHPNDVNPSAIRVELQPMFFGDEEFDTVSPDELEREAERMLDDATRVVPDLPYPGVGDWSRVSFADALATLMGHTLLWPTNQLPAMVIPNTVILEAAQLRRRAREERAGVVVGEESEEEEAELNAKEWGQTLREEADSILGKHGVEIRQRVIDAIALLPYPRPLGVVVAERARAEGERKAGRVA